MGKVKNLNYVSFTKVKPGAATPSQAHSSDSGWDLTLISSTVHEAKNTEPYRKYSTGISVAPPQGYYFEMFARSSLTKTGHFLLNSVGIIDSDYRGEIFVPIFDLSGLNDELPLPGKYVQLVLKKLEPVEWMQSFEVEETIRGDKGFGSSGT